MIIKASVIREDGKECPIEVHVLPPEAERSGNNIDYYVSFKITPLHSEDKKIYGVSKSQAIILSIKYLNALLKKYNVLDANKHTLFLDADTISDKFSKM